jgi:hypothetical protein
MVAIIAPRRAPDESSMAQAASQIFMNALEQGYILAQICEGPRIYSGNFMPGATLP